MASTQLEVTFEAVLAAVEGDVERVPTSREFLDVFDRMADRLYDIDGLVDPGLWGQASNGSIEIQLNYPDVCETEATTECAMAVVRDISAAAGIRLGDCRASDGRARTAAALQAERRRSPGLADPPPRFVLTVAGQTSQVFSV